MWKHRGQRFRLGFPVIPTNGTSQYSPGADEVSHPGGVRGVDPRYIYITNKYTRVNPYDRY